MQLESHELASESLFPFVYQRFIVIVFVVCDTACDTVGIERIIAVLHEVPELAVLLCLAVELHIKRHRKYVLHLETCFRVDKSVLFKSLDRPVVIYMEEFHLLYLIV
jgi:hypothetical protein